MGLDKISEICLGEAWGVLFYSFTYLTWKRDKMMLYFIKTIFSYRGLLFYLIKSRNNFWYYVFSVQCRDSVVPQLFIPCTSGEHLLSPCCSSHVLLFCLSSISHTSLALLKLLYSSPPSHLRTLRRSKDVLNRCTPVPLLLLLAL